jgi:hypothetical protein
MQKIFSILILGLMVAAGAGCSKKSVEPVGDVEDAAGKIAEDVTEGEVDTSNWKTYRNEKLGFGIKYPNYLSESTNISTDPGNEFEFWRDIIGEVYMKTEFWALKDESSINFHIKVKRSNLSLDEFVKNRGIGISTQPTMTTVANLPTWRDRLPIYFINNETGYGFNEQMVIKNNDVFYTFFFDCVADSLISAEESQKTWETLVSTIEIFQIVENKDK